MLGKLDRIKEQQKELRKHYESLNWTQAVIAKLVAQLVGEAADVWYEAYISKPQKVEIKYTVLECISVEDHPQIISQTKNKLIKNINLMGRISHYLLLQYLGVSVEPATSRKQQAPKQIENNKTQKLEGGDETSIQIKSQQVNKRQPQEIKIKLLAQPDIEPFSLEKWKGQIKSKEDFKARLTLCREIVEAVSFLHQHELAFFPFTLEEIAFFNHAVHLKLAAYKFKPWRDTTETDIQEIRSRRNNKLKKAALGRVIKYVAPEFLFKSTPIRDMRLNDTWKVGLFIVTLLSGQDISKEVLGLEDIEQDRIKDYKIVPEDKISKLKKYLNQSQVEEILKTLKLSPSERKPLADLLIDLKTIESEYSQQFDEGTFKDAKQQYFVGEEQNTVRFIEQLKANEEMLSNQHRKKLTQYFKNVQNRVLKGAKVLFRGSHSKFSSRCFYQAVFQKKHLLLVFQDKNQKKKIICYSQEAFDLNKCNGIFGGFIKDSKKLSFIYSPQQNEFCKLKNAERAIGVSHIMGPVIGDGDLAVSDGALLNFCRFPISYEPTGKVKKLFKAQKFELQEYDVYQCLF